MGAAGGAIALLDRLAENPKPRGKPFVDSRLSKESHRRFYGGSTYRLENQIVTGDSVWILFGDGQWLGKFATLEKGLAALDSVAPKSNPKGRTMARAGTLRKRGKNPRAPSKKPATFLVRVEGTKFKVARWTADAGIPFAFVDEYSIGGRIYTRGRVPAAFADKLSAFAGDYNVMINPRSRSKKTFGAASQDVRSAMPFRIFEESGKEKWVLTGRASTQAAAERLARALAERFNRRVKVTKE